MKKFLVGAIVIIVFVIVAIIGEAVASEAPSSTSTPVQSSTSQFYTPKPTATPTILQRLIKALGTDAGTVTYNSVTHIVIIHTTLILPPDPPTHLTYAQMVEQSKFYVYGALGYVYTSGIPDISSVEVHQLWAKCGFTPDIKNNTGQCSGTQLQYPGDFARATCTSTTAKLIDWNNGDDDTAWTVYDSTYLLPS